MSDDPVKLAFADWVVELGTYVGVKVFPKFIHNTQSFALADCMRSTKHPTMRFNLARLPDEFFEPRGEGTTEPRGTRAWACRHDWRVHSRIRVGQRMREGRRDDRAEDGAAGQQCLGLTPWRTEDR